MFKKISFILLLIVSIATLILGGKYILDKQSNQIDFSSFVISNDAETFYIPNIKTYQTLKTDFANFNIPENLLNNKDKALALLSKKKFTEQLYISYNTQKYVIVIKQQDFNVVDFIDFLNNQIEITVNYKANSLMIGKMKHYYFADNNYFAISNKEINLKNNPPFIKSNGNYHYLHQSNLKSKNKYFKHHNNEIYSFTSTTKDTIRGKAISPENYFNTIPANFDTLRFYGSSRLNSDIKNLTTLPQQQQFFSWVENSILHLKKDSLELLIGLQNDLKNLSHILDEQTLSITKDSLLPTPLYKNNFSIHFFESNYDWQKIIPNTNQKFKVYSEINNYNVLANSTQAMYWLIRELQLGNTFSKISTQFSFPKQTHKLTIAKSDSSYSAYSQNWISTTNCFEMEAKTISNQNQSASDFSLLNQFSTDLTEFKIMSIKSNDTTSIICFTNNQIKSYSILGELNWTKKLNSPLITDPKLIKSDSANYLVLFMKNEVEIIDENNNTKKGFPHVLSSEATSAKAIINSTNFRLLINTNNTIININTKGQLTTGWKTPIISKPLRTHINYTKTKKNLLINYTDSNDSLFIINKFGESILNKAMYINMKNISNIVIHNSIQNTYRTFGYSNQYITSQLLSNGQKDSIKLNQKVNPTAISWETNNNQIYLIIEEFNRVAIFNEFGMLEKEIQKPVVNSTLISNQFFENDIIVFSNFKNKELYLLNSYGKRLTQSPILGGTNYSIIDNKLIVYINAQIFIYNLKNN